MTKIIRIALFASGSGTNVENIANFFSNHNYIKPVCVLCNNPKAYVIKRAENLGLNQIVFDKIDFKDGKKITEFLKKNEVDMIVLAGFLWLIPDYLIDMYPGKIINIHPALLPKYGGKGMYGMNVHQAVWENHEKETGITIHTVDCNYDKGVTIFQKKIQILPEDTPDSIANKVHTLEYKYFPEIIKQMADKIILE